MIIPHPEVLLVVGLVGLYLYDSTQLLATNEALLTPSWSGKWSILFGSDSFQVRGKEPLLANPFLPHRPLYRLTWQTEGLTGPSLEWTPLPRTTFYPLAPFILGMAIALFVLVPLGLFSRFGDFAIAAGLIIFYINTLAALAWVWIKRDVYQCTGKQFTSLAFESLTCPPFALNIVRHLSLALPVSEDMLSAGRRLLGEEEWSQVVGRVVTRVNNEIAWEEEGTERASALHFHHQLLQEESNSCRQLKS